MKNTKTNYVKDPFKELKNLKTLTVCSMLIALSVLTSIIFTFYPSVTLKFSISFIFTAIIAMKFGPLVAGCSAAITDIIQYLIKPVGAYIPFLTITCAISGIIYGLFLYKDKTNLWRIIASKSIITIFISTLIDSYILSFYVGKAFKILILSRIIKNAIMLPIEIILLYIIVLSLSKINRYITKTK